MSLLSVPYWLKSALKIAKHICECDNEYVLFKRGNSDCNYTEPHHLVPLNAHSDFVVSLDVEENIVSLCSHCHNLLHYGDEFEEVLYKLYDERKEMLSSVGIDISFEN